jgi:hypothetical protein
MVVERVGAASTFFGAATIGAARATTTAANSPVLPRDAFFRNGFICWFLRVTIKGTHIDVTDDG